MQECILQGLPVSPEMPGVCRTCNLYLSTCLPLILNGYLAGAECDMSYCEFCPHFEECGR